MLLAFILSFHQITSHYVHVGGERMFDEEEDNWDEEAEENWDEDETEE